jgi:hypothetical protein
MLKYSIMNINEVNDGHIEGNFDSILDLRHSPYYVVGLDS